MTRCPVPHCTGVASVNSEQVPLTVCPVCPYAWMLDHCGLRHTIRSNTMFMCEDHVINSESTLTRSVDEFKECPHPVRGNTTTGRRISRKLSRSLGSDDWTRSPKVEKTDGGVTVVTLYSLDPTTSTATLSWLMSLSNSRVLTRCGPS